MEEFTDQIEKALVQNNFLIALFSCLALPDICGAISSDGRSGSQKYKQWFDTYVAKKYNHFFNGSQCYALRCSLIHQGLTNHNKLGYKKVIFLDPSMSENIFLHNNIINDAFNIDIRQFCQDILDGVSEWSKDHQSDSSFRANYDKFLSRRGRDNSSYIDGMEVFF